MLNTCEQTEFYQNNSILINGKIIYTLFSEINPLKHVNIKRPIAKFFSQGNVLAKEVLVDAVIQNMCKQLENRSERQSCDLGEWIAFCESTSRPKLPEGLNPLGIY